MSAQKLNTQKNYNLTNDDLNLLLKVLKQWYCLNDDSGLFTPQVEKLLLKINTTNYSLPQYLYRAYSFETKKDYDNFVKGSHVKIKHPTKDYESWTSSLAVAKNYMPGADAQLNKKAQYGLLIRIPRFDFQDRIKFSMENLFKTPQDRNIFFNEMFQYLSKELMLKIKMDALTKQDILSFEHYIPGLVRAVTEKEYMLGPLDYPQPQTVMVCGPKDVYMDQEPYASMTPDDIKGMTIRHRRAVKEGRQ